MRDVQNWKLYLYDLAAIPYLQPCKQKVTRGHSLKLAKSHSRLNVRSNFFSLRITNLWNSLTKDIVTAPSLIAFENRLDKYWHNTSLNSNYNAKNKCETGRRNYCIAQLIIWIYRQICLRPVLFVYIFLFILCILMYSFKNNFFNL